MYLEDCLDKIAWNDKTCDLMFDLKLKDSSILFICLFIYLFSLSFFIYITVMGISLNTT